MNLLRMHIRISSSHYHTTSILWIRTGIFCVGSSLITKKSKATYWSISIQGGCLIDVDPRVCAMLAFYCVLSRLVLPIYLSKLLRRHTDVIVDQIPIIIVKWILLIKRYENVMKLRIATPPHTHTYLHPTLNPIPKKSDCRKIKILPYKNAIWISHAILILSAKYHYT